MPTGTLIFDIETHSLTDFYAMSPEEYVRLIGYKWKGSDDVTLTTDLEEIREAIRSARWIIGHNIHAFDLRAVFGIHSNEPMELADAGRVFDTFIHAPLVNPAPFEYIDRNGKKALASDPKKLRKFYSLDEQAHQLGVAGKTHDLKALAEEFGGFGEIPVTDERYRDYLVGDVHASEAVARALLALEPLTSYHMREQRIASRAATISSNGFRVDREKAQARVDELAARREAILRDLQDRYGFPTEGKSPWATDEGKAAILSALADYGITPETVDWPKTAGWENRERKIRESHDKAAALHQKVQRWHAELYAGGVWNNGKFRVFTRPMEAARYRWIANAEAEAEELVRNPLPVGFGLSFGGSELIELTKGTGAEELGQALAELKGQRSLAQLALDSCHVDGFTHPEITMLQRSGRWSTTEPGLTIWGNRTPELAKEKAYFLPDSDDHVLLEIDYSNADARVVAWLSGDTKYAERFEPGADGHLINAWAAWGYDVVGDERDEEGKPTGRTKEYRQMAKPLGHGWSYGGQAKTLSEQAGVAYEDAKRFCDGMAEAFSVLIAWQDRVRDQAKQGYVVNPWGRKMFVEPGREFTQAPALMGQSGTREIICDALLAMPYAVLRMVKASIHDALLFSVPRDRWEAARDYLVNLMSTAVEAVSGGQRMDFPAEAQPAGDDWMKASH